jgi:predicted small lipoprotein YifL
MSARTVRLLGALALAAAIPLGLAACGKKGALEPVEGATLDDNVYPAPETVTGEQDDEATR